MKRRHLFEFHELAACPVVLRQLVTGFLEAIARLFRPYSPKTDLLICAMRSTGARRFVDLCSGNGGPWFQLARQVEQKLQQPVFVTLTDKFPSREAQTRADAATGITWLGDSMDARHVPEHLRGVRTLFNGLHHFRPEDVEAVLKDAVAKGQPIAIFETLQRNWVAMIQALILPITVLLLTPLVRPMTWRRFALTYVIPVASLILLWDGAVSILRCYRPEELRTMAESLTGASYRWEAGTYWRRTVPVTYLVGYAVEELPLAPAVQDAVSVET